jgi:hypothetical protein
MTQWPTGELRRIAETDHLHVAPFREDGTTYGTPTRIWSVVVNDALYARAYHGTSFRWYRAVLRQRAGRISTAGRTRNVRFEPVESAIHDRFDDAYRTKYRGSPYLAPMIGPRARAATVRSVALAAFARGSLWRALDRRAACFHLHPSRREVYEVRMTRVLIATHKDELKSTEEGYEMKKTNNSTRRESPSQLIDARIKELGDWRGETLSRIRSLIKQADPIVVEEWKWRGVPVWSHDGLICTGETYKKVVKLTFFKGAQLKDPKRLFNSSLDGNARRAIDLHEGDRIDETAFEALIRDAVALNESSAR